ncbi:HNH endonuclease [Cobetia crustatorum]|uniref:HNH endonuclease n=1 Tax=Cobetia crustatorum TaxID=553385 RepID=A0A558HUX8_9GAMM|nr:HNH endonuclease [Cobetia crustatorum]TVU72915.1 HNH endonuclease [Cobetia crustatorum]
MLNCIYCPDEFFLPGKGSREHVILSSLGGRKASRNICCVKCNRRLGNEIDEPVTNGVKYLANLCSIKTGRGKNTAVIHKAGVFNDMNYSLAPGGEMFFPRSSISCDGDLGSPNNSLRIISGDIDKARVLLDNKLKSFDKEVAEKLSFEAYEYEHYVPYTEMDVDLGLHVHHRSIAKTALTYLATLTSPQRIRSISFGNVINYINGVDESSSYVTFMEGGFPSELHLSPIQHRVMICASSSRKSVIGFVELFGGIKFKILLSDAWEGPSLSSVYVVDGVAGEDVEQSFNIERSKQDALFDIPSASHDEYFKMHMKSFSNAYEQHKKVVEINMIEKILSDFHEEYDECEMTDELRLELATRLANELARYKLRINNKVEVKPFN